MRNGFLVSLPGLLVGVTLVLGQPPQAPMPLGPPAEGGSETAPAEPGQVAPAPPPHSLFDDLSSHFEGTCAIPKGNVLVADVDYLLWVLRDANVPVPLATTAAVGAAGNQILIGQHRLNYLHRPSSGLRLSLAYWQEDPQPEFDWDKPRTMAIEGGFLYLGQRGIAMKNDTAPVIVRPFFDLNHRVESGAVVAGQGITGGVVATANYGLWGGEVNFLKNIFYEFPGRTVRLDALVGFRYLDLGEDLSITSQSIFSQQASFGAFAGNRILINDLFGTRDQFYGGQIGGVAKFFLETVDLNIGFKIAFGENAEQVHIDGFQFRTLANGTVIQSRGGVLALPTNIGRFRGDQFAVVPEVDVIGSYQICRHVNLTAGYTFLYWGRVVRPGDQIDRVVDVTQIPNFSGGAVAPTGVARPAVPFKQTDFWAQGLTVGLQFVW
jgi:hypothetical protein